MTIVNLEFLYHNHNSLNDTTVLEFQKYVLKHLEYQSLIKK